MLFTHILFLLDTNLTPSNSLTTLVEAIADHPLKRSWGFITIKCSNLMHSDFLPPEGMVMPLLSFELWLLTRPLVC